MARTNRHLIDIVTRHQVYLERLKSSLAMDFLKEIGKLDRAITEVIEALGMDIGEVSRKQLNDLLFELESAQLVVMDEAIETLAPQLEDLAGYEAGFEGRALKAAVKRIKIAVPVASKAYKAALARPLSATGELLQPFIKDWSRKEITAVNNLVRKGYVDGWTNQQLLQAVRGTRAARYSDGVIAKVGRNADAVIRTAVQHVASTARSETWAKNADIIEGYRVVATLDSRTTQICRSLDGKVFKLGEGPTPPFHIRCRSTTVAEVDSRFDFLDEGATRSALDGPVSADLNYYDWLKTQPAAFQDDAIGPTRGKLLREGGLSADKFAQLNLGRNFEPLTLEQMRKKEPKAFERAGL